MPTLEDQIAGLALQTAALLPLPQQIAAQASAGVAAVQAAWTARIASMNTEFVVDAANGLDTNPGTTAAPLRTLREALARTPFGGRCVALLAAPYALDASNGGADGLTLIDRRTLIIRSTTNVRHPVTFTPRASPGDPLLRSIHGFSLQDRASLAFSGVRFVMPSATGWSNLTTIGWTASPIHARPVHRGAAVFVAFEDCDIELPADPYAAIIGASAVQLNVQNATLAGPLTSLNGRWLFGTTATAGTQTNTLPGVVSTLGVI
jgi:hypothetical protein